MAGGGAYTGICVRFEVEVLISQQWDHALSFCSKPWTQLVETFLTTKGAANGTFFWTDYVSRHLECRLNASRLSISTDAFIGAVDRCCKRTPRENTDKQRKTLKYSSKQWTLSLFDQIDNHLIASHISSVHQKLIASRTVWFIWRTIIYKILCDCKLERK